MRFLPVFIYKLKYLTLKKERPFIKLNVIGDWPEQKCLTHFDTNVSDVKGLFMINIYEFNLFSINLYFGK